MARRGEGLKAKETGGGSGWHQRLCNRPQPLGMQDPRQVSSWR